MLLRDLSTPESKNPPRATKAGLGLSFQQSAHNQERLSWSATWFSPERLEGWGRAVAPQPIDTG